MASELKFLKGMNKDTGLVDQIDKTHRDALNAVVDINKGAISNEFGNKFVSNLGTYSPNGQIALPDDNFIIFGVDAGPGSPAVTSAIFHININTGVTTTLLKTTAASVKGHLNFDLEHPITGEFRVSPTGEVLIYFTDNKFTFVVEPATKIEYISQYNPPRVFNVTQQMLFIAAGGSNLNLYSDSNPTSISMLNLFMDSGPIPIFDSINLLQGGGISSGAYYLGLSYADKDFTETNVLGMSNPVSITPSPDNYIPFEMVGGAPGGSQSNKSIKWNISNVNTDFKYIVPYILQRINNVDSVYKLEPVEIKTSIMSVTYTGLEQIAKTTKEEAVIDKVRYLTAKSLAQLDNKMYAANLTARKDLGFQRFANGIQLEAITKAVTNFDPRAYHMYNLNTGYSAILRPDDYAATIDLQYITKLVYPLQQGANRGYREPNTIYTSKSYRRGETYAFYISFVLKDGTESYAYHIPGRNISSTGGPSWNPLWENSVLSLNVPSAFNPGEILASDANAKTFQYLDTSIATGLTTGYWENQNETYPNSPDFQLWSVNSAGNPVQVGTIVNQNVRHHRMPTNHNPLYSTIITNTDFSSPGLTVDANGLAVTFKESVRILGIQLKNIRIPKFILDQVQGYKVYYAKRNQGNKTIIGQSGLHPGNFILSGNLASTKAAATQGPFHHLWYMVGSPTPSAIEFYDTQWYPKPILLQGVFKFHDFNLLRNQPTLSTATHIDLQYVATMQQWRGRYKGVNNYATSTPSLYESFRAGHGDDEYAWIHPDLGNMVDYDLSTDPDNANVWGPSSAYGYLMVAAKYNQIGTPGVDVGTAALNIPGNQELLNSYQSVFSIDPDSASYLAGLSFLKNSSSTGFKGATYIVNNSGESSIVLGLKSGIPPLYGYKSNSWAGDDAPYLTKVESKSGRPNVYVANLCSAKTDIFEPFDQQPLVWTGYYQNLLNAVDGTVTINGVKMSYYSGASSLQIFGGDTFICKYAYRTTSQSFAIRYFGTKPNVNEDPVNIFGDIPFTITTNSDGNVTSSTSPNPLDPNHPFSVLNNTTIAPPYGSIPTIKNTANWEKGNVSPITTLYQLIVESDDNINMRHAGDTTAGVATVDSVYFDKYTAADVLWKSPLHDLTKKDNILYEDHYSALQDVRVTVPYPKKDKSTNLFPNRLVRSMVQDGNYTDTYRYFMLAEYKDFGQNKGPITNIFNLNALIYIHTEKSLFKTKGKQNLELADASQAYIGSGDLFAQEPDEFVQSTDGYLGLTNKMGALVTKDGYIFVSRNSRKIFLITDKVQDITDLGMSTWARENFPFVIENYGISLDAYGASADAPTSNFGFLVTYDPLFKRVIVTKRELIPNDFYSAQLAIGSAPSSNSGGIQLVNGVVVIKKDRSIVPLADNTYFDTSGWTISLSLDLGAWASRHSYTPPLYAFNTRYLYSFGKRTTDKFSSSFYVHNDYINPGNFYGSLFNFELEFISTGDDTTSKDGTVSTTKHTNKIYSAVTYLVETYKPSPTNIAQVTNVWEPGFTSFYVYTTEQISGLKDLVYLNNIRKADHSWIFNDFRDMSRVDFSTSLDSGQININGDDYNGTYIPTSSYSMFTSEGVINSNYINSAKPWYEQKKFTDKFLGVRLISNNKAKNLINLYTAKAAYRLSYR